MRFTERSVRGMKAVDGKRTDYTDSTTPGFVLRVSLTRQNVHGAVRGQRPTLRHRERQPPQPGSGKKARKVLMRVEDGEDPQQQLVEERRTKEHESTSARSVTGSSKRIRAGCDPPRSTILAQHHRRRGEEGARRAPTRHHPAKELGNSHAGIAAHRPCGRTASSRRRAAFLVGGVRAHHRRLTVHRLGRRQLQRNATASSIPTIC